MEKLCFQQCPNEHIHSFREVHFTYSTKKYKWCHFVFVLRQFNRIGNRFGTIKSRKFYCVLNEKLIFHTKIWSKTSNANDSWCGHSVAHFLNKRKQSITKRISFILIHVELENLNLNMQSWDWRLKLSTLEMDRMEWMCWFQDDDCIKNCFRWCISPWQYVHETENSFG